MTRSYIRGLAVLLLAYGLAGLAVSDVSGWARFGWLEVAAAIAAGLAAFWLGFRRSMATELPRAARVYALTLVSAAAYGLWGPIIPEATLELPEIALWALVGIVGLIVVLREEAPAVMEKSAVDVSDRGGVDVFADSCYPHAIVNVVVKDQSLLRAPLRIAGRSREVESVDRSRALPERSINSIAAPT